MCYMDAVALVGAAGDYLAQEDHLTTFLGHSDVEVLHPGQEVRQVYQLVIVGGKQRLGAEPGVVVNVFCYSLGDGKPVVG